MTCGKRTAAGATGSSARPAGDGSPLRRRVLVSIVAVAACAVTVLTVPLAWSMDRLYRGGAVARLQRDAVWLAAGLPRDEAYGPGSGHSGHSGHSSQRPPAAAREALYTPAGRRLSGNGPPSSRVAEAARDGSLHQGVEGSHLAVSVPVARHGVVTAVVRVWTPWDSITDRRSGTWLLLAATGAAIVGLSVLLAVHLARRVAVPLERLTETARALGAGDFTIQPVRSGIREADAAGRALAATARRLGEVLERERSFSTAVSHQLRTPLTALVLGLEAARTQDDRGRRTALDTALRRADHLGETIDDLLRLARETHGGGEGIDAAEVLERIARRNRDAVAEAGRRLTVRCEPELPLARGSVAATVQVVQTLVDNALTHGRGEIRLTAVDVGAGVAIEVGDDGPGPAAEGDRVFESAEGPGRRHGIGLTLARSLAEAEGGRLLLRRAGPRPVFSLMLPAADPEAP
ncbi:sensor histidine kinase [Streptomyces montanisoli]|nr:HAMP domain-containing sensor histidine kinase [Streptomyces montanisoli]